MIIGTCSKCGGPVTSMPSLSSMSPSPATCMHCGGRPKNPYGKVIEMEEDKSTTQLLLEKIDK